MLTEVCNFIHNYFEYERNSGEYTIENGMIDLDEIVRIGQRFRIVGSAMNDGIYTYRAEGIYDDDNKIPATLDDETFTGCIVSMSVPKAVLQIVSEIVDWITANKAVLDSPYVSESFGGYSYTKASGTGSSAALSGSGRPLTWREQFGTRLNAYRKIA